METWKSLIKRVLFKTKSYQINSVFNRCYILCYHMVARQPNGFYPEISVRKFEQHLAHLARNYQVVSLEELVKRIRERRSLRNRVAITFDDGFKDNFENAYPILKKYNLPATIFLATGYIENGTVPWFITLRYIFMKTEKKDFVCEVNGKSLQVPMRTIDERYAASEIIMTQLKSCSDESKAKLLYELRKRIGINGSLDLDNVMLNWKEVKEMAENGITFGAHTVTHPVISNISAEMARQEIKASKYIIEKKVDKPVQSFAYPFGKRKEYSAEIFPILKELQFNCAVNTEEGANTHNSDLFQLKRGTPWELSMLNTDFRGTLTVTLI